MTDPTWIDRDDNSIDPDDNSTLSASGGMYGCETRTASERARDRRRWRRKQTLSGWWWRVRGLLPRGWKDDEY